MTDFGRIEFTSILRFSLNVVNILINYYFSSQTKYFRHFRFFDDGRALYILNNKYPIDTVSQFKEGKPIPKKVFVVIFIAPLLLRQVNDVQVFLGAFTLRRNEVKVQVK